VRDGALKTREREPWLQGPKHVIDPFTGRRSAYARFSEDDRRVGEGDWNHIHHKGFLFSFFFPTGVAAVCGMSLSRPIADGPMAVWGDRAANAVQLERR
jgi:hypothetical protein